MTDIVTYCDIYTCEDCPRYGDDCDGSTERLYTHKEALGMTDLIRREDAIAYIDRVIKSGLGRHKSLNYIRKYISALPSAELTLQTPQTYGKSINPSNAEVVEDLISRADAIEAVGYEIDDGYNAIVDRIKALPSADAVPHGRLIDADALIEKIDKEMQKPIIDRIPIIDIIATMIGGDTE